MILSPIYRLITLALITWVVIFLSLNPLPESHFGKTADEGYYSKYASSVLHKGKKVFNRMILWYASSDEARVHPAPIRVGYILLSAFLFKLTGQSSIAILALISTLSFFLFLFVCFFYVRKYFDLDTALLTVLFLSSSPLMIGLSRRGLVDSPANLLWGLTVWLFLDVLLKPNRLSYVYFLAALCVSITFKESSLILIPFFVVAGFSGLSRGAVISFSKIVGIVICPLIFILVFYGWIYGGLGVLKTAALAIFKTHLSSHYLNSYAID